MKKKPRVKKKVVRRVAKVEAPKEAKTIFSQPTPESPEYEQFLINKIDKCQRIVAGLRNNEVWAEIRSDYEAASNSLDLSWAYADGSSANFRSMQSAKMASQTFMNMLPNYEHDLNMAIKNLKEFQSPGKTIKRDFDEEGIMEVGKKDKQDNAYHE